MLAVCFRRIVSITGVDCPAHEEDCFKTHEVLLEILAVERNDVLLDELTAAILQGNLNLLLLFLGRTLLLNEVFIGFIQHEFDELRVVGLLYDAVCDN